MIQIIRIIRLITKIWGLVVLLQVGAKLIIITILKLLFSDLYILINFYII
jgi:hypothetical protein